MIDLSVPETIITLLDATRSQIDIITTLSSGGVGVIVLTWARILGIFDDADFPSFKKPGFLVFPALCLLCAIVIGYLTGAQTTGYYSEIASGVNSSTGKPIHDANAYYFASYDGPFYWMMAVQLFSSILGITLLVGWFVWNILRG